MQESTSSAQLPDLKTHLVNAMIMMHNKRTDSIKEQAYYEVLCALYSLLLDISVRCDVEDANLESSILLDNGFLFLGKK